MMWSPVDPEERRDPRTHAHPGCVFVVLVLII